MAILTMWFKNKAFWGYLGMQVQYKPQAVGLALGITNFSNTGLGEFQLGQAASKFTIGKIDYNTVRVFQAKQAVFYRSTQIQHQARIVWCTPHTYVLNLYNSVDWQRHELHGKQ